ncbi:MAG: hypothetical protein PHG47_11320 [Sulfuricella sp.]|nr:hypothetical protein [Sulfuricella sp.]
MDTTKKNTMKKTILIVEDLDNHYKEIKTILNNNNFDVLPLSINNERFYSNENFVRLIRTIYDTDIEDELIDKSKSELITLINNVEIGGLIIDYELEQRKSNCSGVNFYNNFIETNDILRNLPVLFLTGMKGTSLNKVIEFIKSINENRAAPTAFFMSKDKFSNKQFHDDLERKINTIFINYRMPENEREPS